MIRAVQLARAHMATIRYCRARLFPQHSICNNRVICPFARTVHSRPLATQWKSNPTVFPGFDLGLLGQTDQVPAKSFEPDASSTYPVGKEEVFNGKYQVLSKIGYGPTETVWLAVDWETGQLFVLKIYVVAHILEAYGRTHLLKTYPRNEYPLREVVDRFVLNGPEGKHICVVHAPPSIDVKIMMESQEKLNQSGDKLDLESMRPIIRQILELLDFLHTDCKLTARVDPIKYREAYPDIESNKVSDLTTTLLPGDGVPILADFGIEDDGMGLDPKDIRAPEEILKSSYGEEVQIWATAMVAWDFVSPQSLINGRNAEGAFDDRVHIAELVALLGPPPPGFRDKTTLGSVFWDEEGQWTGQTTIPDRSLDTLSSEVEGENLNSFLGWIRKALQWDPAARPTALGLMRHEWMARESEAKKEE